jgi:hypothetical protein
VKIRELRQEYKSGRGGTPGTCFHTHFITSTYVLSCTNFSACCAPIALNPLCSSIGSRVRAFVHKSTVISYTKCTCFEAQLVRASMHIFFEYYVLRCTQKATNSLIIKHFSWINSCLKTYKNYTNKRHLLGAVLFLKVGEQTT